MVLQTSQGGEEVAENSDSSHSGEEEEVGSSVRFEIPIITRTEYTSPTDTWYTPLPDSDTNSDNNQFLKQPPKQRKSRRKKRKSKHPEKCKSQRKASVKTIDSIPESIPEENSEDVVSSDPDIDTVEYDRAAATAGVASRDECEARNQETVHSIHQIFAEMDELVCEQGEDVWEEKARWMKFEQDIHRGADKWSKPHVAFLQLHSVISLRKCIAQGTVLLGMKAFDLESVIEMTLDRLVSRALITSSVAGQLKTLLLKRHVHTGEHQQEGMLKFRYRGKGGLLARISEGFSPDVTPPGTRITSRTSSEQDIIKMKQHFLRKLPADTEASNVMIGKLDYLDSPICVTIRLSHSILLGDITEVPIPTRFIFLLLCPQHSNIDHVEVGRAASTLFSDEMFYKAAYIATSKAEVVQGIDRFLEKAIVIPPSEWDPKMKITMPEEDDSSEEMLEKEDEDSADVEAMYSHTVPFGGVVCDMESLKTHWIDDWKRGFHLPSLLSPLQFSVILISYTLLLLHLSSESLNFPIALSLTGVFVITLVTSVACCQPMVVCCVSLPTVLWEMAVEGLCHRVGVDYTASIRPTAGLVSGTLLILSSILNAGNLFPCITVFVYETVMSALPFTLVAVVAIAIASLPQDSHLVACKAVLLLLTIVFLKIWESFSASTLCTKRIRLILKFLKLPCLVLLTSILVAFTPLNTVPYFLHPSTNTTIQQPGAATTATQQTPIATNDVVIATDNTTNSLLKYHSALFASFRVTQQKGGVFPSQVGLIVGGIVAGVGLTILELVIGGIVHSWVLQPHHRLKRFSGRYWDLCLVGIAAIFSGVYNLPYLVPDPLLTPILLHLIGVSSTARHPDTLYIREQRVTLALTSLIVVIPTIIVPYLHVCLPLPLCWGVVIFYNIMGLRYTQFFERCKILLQSEKYHPEKSYVANTPQRVINAYTVLQVILMCVLVVVMVTPYACSSLPVLLILLVLLRKHIFPLVIVEEFISLLEETNTPSVDRVEQTRPSPAQSLANQVEFSEEVAKISASGADHSSTVCVSDHAVCVTDHAARVTDHAETHSVNGRFLSTEGAEYSVFPHIIFDNLTDEDDLVNKNSCRYSVADTAVDQDLVLNFDPAAPASCDYLGQESHRVSCPALPFQDEEPPVKSTDPYPVVSAQYQPAFHFP